MVKGHLLMETLQSESWSDGLPDRDCETKTLRIDAKWRKVPIPDVLFVELGCN
jgi:hypothetical protein